MASYLVRAELKPDLAADLHTRLMRGELRLFHPFGNSLHGSLMAARWDSAAGQAVWEEECFCSPPLAEERSQVLDRYCSQVVTEPVDRGAGWRAIASLPNLWEVLQQR